jgi:hypothetical protein
LSVTAADAETGEGAAVGSSETTGAFWINVEVFATNATSHRAAMYLACKFIGYFRAAMLRIDELKDLRQMKRAAAPRLFKPKVRDAAQFLAGTTPNNNLSGFSRARCGTDKNVARDHFIDRH